MGITPVNILGGGARPPCPSRVDLYSVCVLHSCCTRGSYLLAALSRHYNAKMSLEHQLPTASQKLKVTDECILAAVVSLVTCTSKVWLLVVGFCSGQH